MKNTFRNALVTIGSFIFVISIVSAWTVPKGNPPADNVAAPINVSINPQVKAGGLGVGSLQSLGAIQIGNTNTACSVALAGSVRWTGTGMEYCDGTTWSPFGGGGGGGSSSSYFTRFTYTAKDGAINCYPFGSSCTYNATDGKGYYGGSVISVFQTGDKACALSGGTCVSVGYGLDKYAFCSVDVYQHIANLYPNPIDRWEQWAGMGAQCTKNNTTGTTVGTGASFIKNIDTSYAVNTVHGPAKEDLYIGIFMGGNGLVADHAYICAGMDKDRVGKCYCDKLGVAPTQGPTCNGSGPGSGTIRARAMNYDSGFAFVKKGEYWQGQYFQIPPSQGNGSLIVYTMGY